jgi:tetratricopeptide (TPR) repeat protein
VTLRPVLLPALLATIRISVSFAQTPQDFELRFHDARQERIQGNTTDAIRDLSNLADDLKKHPELTSLLWKVQEEVAQSYLSAKNRSKIDVEKAAAVLETLAVERPEDGDIRYRLGLLYRGLGEERRAAASLQAGIAHGASHLAAQVNLMEAAFASGQSTLGLETARKVISLNVDSPAPLMRVGALLFSRLFYKDALRAFDRAHQLDSQAFEPRFFLALTHYLLKEYAAAAAALDGKDVESNPEAASLAASSEAQLGHTERAVAILQHVIALHPESPHPYFNLGLIDLDLGKTGEAEEAFGKLRALPEQRDTKVFYSVNRNSCREFAKDVSGGEAPAQLAPYKAEFYYRLAVQLLARFHYASALELVRLAKAEEGASARILYVAGVSCLNMDPQSDEPMQLLKQTIALTPKADQTYYMLGRAYARRGNLEQAAAEYQKAVDIHPDPAYYLNLGKMRAKGGNQAAAIAAYEQALTLSPVYAEAHLELGRSLMKMQNFARAKPELEKALELEPDFYEADFLLARLVHQSGDEEQSRRYLASFEAKKSALMEQSVVGSGYIFGGQ